MDISDRYNVQISFDDRDLSKYKVSLAENFPDPEACIRKLIKGLPLECEKKDNVFVIYPIVNTGKNVSGLFTGQVLEKGSMEPLPYSHVIINGRGTVTDLKGSFAFSPGSDSLFRIRISHLGYYIKDTVLLACQDVRFLLNPSIIALSEVVIRNSIIERSTQIGDQAGTMKLNHQIATFLPGFGDNSVFNLLRLQPGILASGEQTNDLIVWGSYEGQSEVLFDGFTIYGLKNFNDNISSFNPLMAKDIEVYKGGYDARFGERVGGIVNITGKNGNTQHPSFSVTLNNMTLNSMVEIPLFRHGSLVIAVRHTYYELYNPSDLNSLLKRNNNPDTSNNVDLTIVPDYRFRDINIKYSAKIHEKDLFYISLYGGNDRFSYSVDQAVKNVTLKKNTLEENTQSGGAFFYGKEWKQGYSTNFSVNYSSLKTLYTDELSVTRPHFQETNYLRDKNSRNTIGEFTTQADNRFVLDRTHTLEGGLVFKSNRVELHEDTFNVVLANLDDKASRITFYLQDNMSIGKKLNLKAGMRLTHALNLQRFYAEPRVSLSFKANDYWKINAAWGLYDQFITKSSVVDDLGNYRYIWTICDNQDIPVLKASHFVLGTALNRSNWIFSLEGYFKKVRGLTRYIRNAGNSGEGIYLGHGRSYGLDLMIKKDFKGNSAWISYSLSRTEEIFDYFKKQNYRRAPQDQTHELKGAVLINLDPFYLSADYVYGSGFPSTATQQFVTTDTRAYSRLDVAFIYKFLNRRLKGEIGLSVLNVLNTQNIKYANFERIPDYQTNSINIYAEAIPLTPALYFKLSL